MNVILYLMILDGIGYTLDLIAIQIRESHHKLTRGEINKSITIQSLLLKSGSSAFIFCLHWSWKNIITDVSISKRPFFQLV